VHFATVFGAASFHVIPPCRSLEPANAGGYFPVPAAEALAEIARVISPDRLGLQRVDFVCESGDLALFRDGNELCWVG
jgi:hypothetical protein